MRQILDEEEKRKRNSARQTVNFQIRTGKLKRGECGQKNLECKGDIEAHHPDYEKPLEVVWLCTFHHGRVTSTERAKKDTPAIPPDHAFERSDSAYIGMKEAARIFGVHRNTLMRWINAGTIAAIQPAGPRGSILIPKP